MDAARVGLTPGDRYRVHVADDTKLVNGWEMLLQSNKDGRWKPALWTDWTPVGDIKLATRRHIPDDRALAQMRRDQIECRPSQTSSTARVNGLGGGVDV